MRNKKSRTVGWRILVAVFIGCCLVTWIGAAAESSDNVDTMQSYGQLKQLGGVGMFLCVTVSLFMLVVQRLYLQSVPLGFRRDDDVLKIWPVQQHEIFVVQPEMISGEGLVPLPKTVNRFGVRTVFFSPGVDPVQSFNSAEAAELVRRFPELKVLDLQHRHLDSELTNDVETLSDLDVMVVPASISPSLRRSIDLAIPAVKIEVGPVQLELFQYPLTPQIETNAFGQFAVGQDSNARPNGEVSAGSPSTAIPAKAETARDSFDSAAQFLDS
jgi:hypothetical protein